jgi:hypothetical protein
VPEGRPCPEDLLRAAHEAGVKHLVLAVVLLAGCASDVGQPSQPILGPPPPDFRGTWSGTWGGTPLTFVVTEQRDLGPDGGVYLGPLPVLGQRVPGVLGVLTSTIGGSPVSASARGWLGSTGTAVTLLVHARTPHGLQELTLMRVRPDRLVGRGESEFSWGPTGEIELSRPAT